MQTFWTRTPKVFEKVGRRKNKVDHDGEEKLTFNELRDKAVMLAGSTYEGTENLVLIIEPIARSAKKRRFGESEEAHEQRMKERSRTKMNKADRSGIARTTHRLRAVIKRQKRADAHAGDSQFRPRGALSTTQEAAMTKLKEENVRLNALKTEADEAATVQLSAIREDTQGGNEEEQRISATS